MTVEISSSSDIYRALLLQISSSIVWKNSNLANSYESNTDPYYVELFVTAKRGMLNFEVIRSFDEGILNQVGLSGDSIYPMLVDKNKIPQGKRQDLVNAYVNRLTNKDPATGRYTYYVEENNYYRMLAGLPDLEDTDYVYVTKVNTPWPMDVPVHEMTIAQRADMEMQGYLDELIAAHPDKKYLKYLGSKCIDFFDARVANRFDILYCESDNSTFEEDFRNTYNANKNQVNRVYYSEAYKRSSDLYENFLAMCILFMTVVQMGHKYLDTDTTRDFYDTESLRYVYDSYQVPFFSEIPLEYHVRIVKQMNRLIMYKGSSTVFFDLFDLFDAGSMDIYSYYITKTHRFNDDGTPVFSYNEDGTPNYEEMYNVQFSKVKLFNDPALEITDPTNTVGYYDLTNTDPYWINDKELLDKVFSEDYNYMETKYIGIQTILDVLGTTYKNAYFIKMLQDNKDVMDRISIRWSATSSNVTLFEFFAYMAALYCRKYGYDGNLTDELAYTATVLGYNFQEHVHNFQQLIMHDPQLASDTQLVQLVSTMNTNSLNDVNRTFQNINDLRQLLVEKFTNARTREEYQTYRDLYDILLTSENMKSSFTKTDGTMASSYYDLLADQNPDLYSRLLGLTEDTIDDEIRLVIMQIEKSIPSVRNLDSLFGLDVNSLIDSLFKILNFFKSEKAELVGYNIVFMMSLRGVNFFKMIDELYFIHDSIDYIPDEFHLTDIMNTIKLKYETFEDTVAFAEYYKGHDRIKLIDYIKWLRDDLVKSIFVVKEILKDPVLLEDFITGIHTHMLLKSSLMPLEDGGMVIKEVFLEPKYHGTIKDQFYKLVDELEELPNTDPILCKSLMDINDAVFGAIEVVRDIHLKMNTAPLFPKDSLRLLAYKIYWSNDLLSQFENLTDLPERWEELSEVKTEWDIEDYIHYVSEVPKLTLDKGSQLTFEEGLNIFMRTLWVEDFQFKDTLRELRTITETE